MDCLVTGASGYIGSALLPALQASGAKLRCVVHRGSTPVGETLRTDLTEGLSASALEGVDTVYHLAGLAHQHAEEAAYTALNVNVTRALAEAAAEAGVRRFIYLSSVKAGLAGSASGPYGRSKAVAEAALRDLGSRKPMEIAIVRPALVYGGAPRGYLKWLERWVQARMPAPPPGGERAMVAREDLVAALLRLRDAPVSLTTPLTITVTDGERYSAARLHRALCEAAGKPPLLPTPPGFLWRLAAASADLLSGEVRGSTWGRLQGKEYVQGSDLTSLLGFAPKMRFEDVAAQGAARA